MLIKRSCLGFPWYTDHRNKQSKSFQFRNLIYLNFKPQISLGFRFSQVRRIRCECQNLPSKKLNKSSLIDVFYYLLFRSNVAIFWSHWIHDDWVHFWRPDPGATTAALPASSSRYNCHYSCVHVFKTCQLLPVWKSILPQELGRRKGRGRLSVDQVSFLPYSVFSLN